MQMNQQVREPSLGGSFKSQKTPPIGSLQKYGNPSADAKKNVGGGMSGTSTP